MYKVCIFPGRSNYAFLHTVNMLQFILEFSNLMKMPHQENVGCKSTKRTSFYTKAENNQNLTEKQRVGRGRIQGVKVRRIRAEINLNKQWDCGNSV